MLGKPRFSYEMAKQKQTEPKLILEKEYIVPLRKGWLKVPKYKRANKAVKTLKEFIARHMKIYDRDLRKIKLDIDLNNEIRFRGMKKPLSKIKIKAKKYDNDIVKIELVDIPEKIKFERIRKEKKKSELDKKIKEKPKEETKEEEKPEDVLDEESEETKEKEKSSRDEGLKLAKQQAKETKHISKDKKVVIKRTALAK